MSRAALSAIGGALLVAGMSSCGTSPTPFSFSIDEQMAAIGTDRAPSFERLSLLRGWQEQASVRERWMFLAERDAFEWFGAPSEIIAVEGVEYWKYYRDLGESFEEYVLGFHRGRLISVGESRETFDDGGS